MQQSRKKSYTIPTGVAHNKLVLMGFLSFSQFGTAYAYSHVKKF